MSAPTDAWSAGLVDDPDGDGGDVADGRRTRPRLLEEVRREVEVMSLLKIKGPASLLQRRLAERGVQVTLATLRSGDCRPLLARVWRRRPPSRTVHGRTDGYEAWAHAQLVEHVLDLRSRVSRVEADLAGRLVEPAAGPERDPRSLAVCSLHAGHVAAMSALIGTVVKDLGDAGVHPDFTSVSDELSRRGRPLTIRSIQRREEYWRPILEYLDIHRPRLPEDPARGPLSRLCRGALAAMAVSLQARLTELNARFEASLVE